MTVDPAENSGYAFRCAALSGGAVGSGSGMIARSVVLYRLVDISICHVDEGDKIHSLSGCAVFLRLGILNLVSV